VELKQIDIQERELINKYGISLFWIFINFKRLRASNHTTIDTIFKKTAGCGRLRSKQGLRLPEPEPPPPKKKKKKKRKKKRDE